MAQLTLKLTPFIAVLAIYLALLSRRLQTRHPQANPRPPPTAEEYADADSYHEINMLEAIPRTPTHTGYAIIGGSGFLGLNLIRLMLLRGESSIRILDLSPPPDDLLANPAISFVRTDITSLPSLLAGLSEKFKGTGAPPTAVFHMAAIIRFWERASYTWPISYKINVQGTANVLAAVQQVHTVRTLIYTSSGDAVLPPPKLWTLWYNTSNRPWNTVVRRDEDPPLAEGDTSASCYSRSKKMAEDLVKAANGVGSLRTGILRPSYTILGPNDRLLSTTLNMARVPVFDRTFSQTSVNVQDVAAAHLLYEQALEQKSDEVAGKAFLISGPREAWTLEDIRNAVKHYSARPLIFDPIPPLAIYIIAHIIETSLYIRWHTLYPLYSLLGRRPSLFPSWLGEAVYLQPATLEYFADVEIDDSRARRVLGYRPQWGMLQTIKHVVDEFDSGASGSKHGMQLRDLPEVDM